VNFPISVGSRIPRSTRLFALSAAALAIVPAYQAYRYFEVDDRIVIVEPTTYEIVDVIETGPAARVVRLDLTPGQRSLVLDSIPGGIEEDIPLRLALGVDLPPRIVLHEFPPLVVSRIPELESYGYVVTYEDVAIVDPRSREIVLMIRR